MGQPEAEYSVSLVERQVALPLIYCTETGLKGKTCVCVCERVCSKVL